MSLKMMTIDKLRFISEASQHDKSSLGVVVAPTLDCNNKSSVNYRYHSSCSCFNDPNCKKCFYLPICNGKCSWYQLKNKYKGGQFNLCQCLLKAPGMRNKILEKYYDHITK